MNIEYLEPKENVETTVQNNLEEKIVNDVSIKVTELGAEGKKTIIVNGIDITNLPVSELTEELADEMTEEQAAEYIKGFTEEEVEAFREVYGFIITAPKMSEEEIKERTEKRASIISGISTPQAEKTTPPVQEEVKEEAPKTTQTGNVIFGVRN